MNTDAKFCPKFLPVMVRIKFPLAGHEIRLSGEDDTHCGDVMEEIDGTAYDNSNAGADWKLDV
jgi:hypothetical protein